MNALAKEICNRIWRATQGTISGPILLNIDLIGLFYGCKESSIASYAMKLPHSLPQGTPKQYFLN